MTVVPFKRGGGEPPREAPHIDREPDLYRRIEPYGIANRLGIALRPFTRPTQPPKGAA